MWRIWQSMDLLYLGQAGIAHAFDEFYPPAVLFGIISEAAAVAAYGRYKAYPLIIAQRIR